MNTGARIIECKHEKICGIDVKCIKDEEKRYVEFELPRLRHINDNCRVTAFDDKLYLYTGRRVICLGKITKQLSYKQMTIVGIRETQAIINSLYAKNEVII